MVDRFERFSLAIGEVYRLWHKVSADEMEKYGLKGPHAIYLTTMLRHKDGITATQLCEICGKDKADVSRAMAMMVKKGMVAKESADQSTYRGLLKLTPEGEKAAKLVQRRVCLAAEFAGKELTQEKRAVFYEALELIVTNLREMCKTGIPQTETEEG